MRRDAVEDEHHMRDEEAEKDRQQDLDRLPHAAQVEIEKQQDQPQLGPQLKALRGHRQQAEDGIGAARDRDRDRQHIVDNERRSRDQPCVRADQISRDLVSAAAGGEELDHLVVGDGDDKDRESGGSSHVKSEMGMLSEGEKRLLRTVAGG
jgi:hypothetical protein